MMGRCYSPDLVKDLAVAVDVDGVAVVLGQSGLDLGKSVCSREGRHDAVGREPVIGREGLEKRHRTVKVDGNLLLWTC
jgi:hypothetical protein